MEEDLLKALETSDAVRASELFREEISRGRDPWEIHLSLFSCRDAGLKSSLHQCSPSEDVQHLPRSHPLPEEGRDSSFDSA